MDKVQLSIVTISLNAAQTISETINSVCNQTFSGFEYIIKDGLSEDKTIEIASSYKDIFKEKGIDFYIIEKKDSGIYDAMNQALELCKGTWIMFLNSGDSLYDEGVLNCIFGGQKSYIADCIYGNTVNVKENVEYVKKGYPISSIYYRVPFIHQASFIKREAMERYKFDLRYQIAADYDVYARMFDDGLKFSYIDCNIARFDLAGVSQTNRNKAQYEVGSIQREHGYYKKSIIKRIWFNQFIVRLKGSRIVYILYAKFKRRMSIIHKEFE